MPAQVGWSIVAENDLDGILDDLERDAGRRTAQRVAREFRAAIALLADFPDRGASRPAFGKDIRMIRVAPYLVLYEGTPDGDAVQIIRILHGSRKITPAMIAKGQ